MQFNEIILKNISNNYEVPKMLITELSTELFNLKTANQNFFHNTLTKKFGDYMSKITPYLYEWVLSNTQSRRSRDGQEFEYIIYSLYNINTFVTHLMHKKKSGKALSLSIM
ncbi:type II restriction endonuclease [Candidatus Liberibacter asiaticus]|uniref:Type II restriction endonuclease n=2 Tax=Liberibacter asiaticus TaxID=34021 RepID=C6XF35_LIBAP|nr:type II restriction endonuclease [Candidatus Liberibacter asiaticus str. psy62]AGH17047.1 type II restriction endonuclease [Candidatus Liberibacter asiaticus str. gxpsy]ALK07372.1 type II restriction endonuclease [Candidatus Liberibacter asiaticus]BAP26567.1 type II restriction endonuclease [Candidatus Liberibacter asiaticus str. Ishi-1]ASK52864.1 type II restriction endonuclease [Candidatus Liberibacter asiaticus]